MIIVRLLVSRAFCLVLAPPKFTRAWEPTLLWNQLHQLSQMAFCGDRLLPARAGRRRYGVFRRLERHGLGFLSSRRDFTSLLFAAHPAINRWATIARPS